MCWTCIQTFITFRTKLSRILDLSNLERMGETQILNQINKKRVEEVAQCLGGAAVAPLDIAGCRLSTSVGGGVGLPPQHVHVAPGRRSMA